jgi:hypothetical protein
MGRVIHIADREHTPNEVYIGRPTVFGNPFHLGRHGERAEVLEKFRTYFNDRLAKDPIFWKQVQGLIGRTLVCHCKPLACHGDVIAEYLRVRYNDPLEID